jgi:hypothetical protein
LGLEGGRPRGEEAKPPKPSGRTPARPSDFSHHSFLTTQQYNLPEIGKKIAYKANREGVAERFDDAVVQKNIEVDLALITYYDELLKELELYILKTAKKHDANTLYLLQTVPGIGKILSLVLPSRGSQQSAKTVDQSESKETRRIQV